MANDRMVWVDIETTGLDPEVDIILEVGLVVTNVEGVILDKWKSLVFDAGWHDFITTKLETVVRDMHIKSGLIDDLMNVHTLDVPNATEVGDAAQEWLADLDLNCYAYPMCGSSVHFDRAFLKSHMPHFESWFHYRNIDVSSVLEICKLVNPDVSERTPGKRDAHRVIEDLEDTTDLYRFFLDNFLYVSI